MPALDLVTAKQLATLTGLDARTCRTAVLAAGLHEYAGKAFERGPALKAIAANTDHSAAIGHRAVGRGHALQASELSLQRARSEAARALKLERDNAVKSGDLISRQAVTTAVQDIIARARQHFMGLGPRCSARLAAIGDERRILEVLDVECRNTLNELSASLDAEVLS